MDISFTRYAAGGGKAADGVHFGVTDFADLPDADAGTDLAGCYRSDPRDRKVRESGERYRVPPLYCGIVIFVLLICCTLAVSVRTYARNQKVNEIETMVASMNRTRQDNLVLQKQVEEVQDLSRIGYIAVKQLGMVASGAQNNIVMYMPEVEAYAGSLTRDGADADANIVTAASSATEDAALDNARAER